MTPTIPHMATELTGQRRRNSGADGESFPAGRRRGAADELPADLSSGHRAVPALQTRDTRCGGARRRCCLGGIGDGHARLHARAAPAHGQPHVRWRRAALASLIRAARAPRARQNRNSRRVGRNVGRLRPQLQPHARCADFDGSVGAKRWAFNQRLGGRPVRGFLLQALDWLNATWPHPQHRVHNGAADATKADLARALHAGRDPVRR